MKPIKTVKARKIDRAGRIYHTIYVRHVANCCIALGDRNIIVPVEPNFTLRQGDSRFGEEVFVQLIKRGKIQRSYDKSSPEDHIEFYLPSRTGMTAMQRALRYWDSILNSDGNEEMREDGPYSSRKIDEDDDLADAM